MYVLFVVAVVLIAALLFLLDRGLKAVQRGRRRRDAAIRLGAAAAYAEAQADAEARKKQTSGALTTVLPSIQQPEQGPRRVA
jgi:type II secretory pathway component PulJ